MFVHYRTQGLILKKEDRGEADQLFTIYTRDFGKLEILGKAIRKISSKLRSGIEIFYLSEIEFIQGKTHKTLTDAILVEKFRNLGKSLKRLAIAYKISEVLDNLVKGQEPDEKIWQLLNETFEKLDNPRILNTKCQILYYYFFWDLLSILGYQPELYQCALCQKKLGYPQGPEKLYFSSKEGGIICQVCSQKIKTKKELTPEIIKILRIILKKDWGTLLKLKIEAKYLKELSFISQDYFSLVCGKNSLFS